jgi:hypothetical protein
MMIKCFQRSALVLIAVLLAGTMSVHAQQPEGTPSTEPATPLPAMLFEPSAKNEGGRLTATLEPGASTTFIVSIGNIGEIPFRFVTYAADAFTARNGGFGLFDLDSEPSGATAWLEFPTESYDLEPGEAFERSFDVTVPEGTAPGEYVTGIAMQTADPLNAADEGMFRFDQVFRTVLGIRIIVPGASAPELEIGEPSMIIEGGVAGIVVPLSNTGNEQVTPAGTIAVRTADGINVLAGDIQLGAFYAGFASEIFVGLPAPLADGTYEIDVTLVDADGASLNSVTAVPFDVDSSTFIEGVAKPVAFVDAVFTPLPDAANPQLVVIDATISNTAEPISQAQLTLVVELDGAEMERLIVNQSLALPFGDTVISERYLPLTGWTSGTWTFALELESIDSSGVAVAIDVIELDGEIEIP